MEVSAYLVADPQAVELVQLGEGPLDYPAGPPASGAVGDSAASDPQGHAAVTGDAAVLVVVVAAVGFRAGGAVGEVCHAGPDRWDRVQQRQELSDIVAIAASQCDGERGAVPVNGQVVLAARPTPVDRRGPGVRPLERAEVRTIGGCVVHLQRAARSELGEQPLAQTRHACLGPVPQSPSGRDAAATDPLGRNVPPAHAVVYTIPRSAVRSSIGSRPGWRYRRGARGGSSASRSHRSSGTGSPVTCRTLSLRASAAEPRPVSF